MWQLLGWGLSSLRNTNNTDMVKKITITQKGLEVEKEDAEKEEDKISFLAVDFTSEQLNAMARTINQIIKRVNG